MRTSLDSRFSRRVFLHNAAVASGALMFGSAFPAASADLPKRKGSIMTVLGEVPAEKLGFTLTHEHVLVDFIGADRISPDRYDQDEAFTHILPHLKEVKELGCRALAECTPAYIGRDPLLLKRLSLATGLHLLTNTGYYGASDNKFLPKHAFSETADELAARWIAESRNGIGSSNVIPGFIKIGVGGETLSELHKKLVRAAARAHLATGLVVASHTGPARLALEQLDIFTEEKTKPSAFIWVHAQSERDMEQVLKVARRGCWISFDGYSEPETERYLQLVRTFRDEKLLEQLLLSHDAGWYKPGEPNGGEFRPFNALQRAFLPKLKSGGIRATEISQVFEANPARAFGG